MKGFSTILPKCVGTHAKRLEARPLLQTAPRLITSQAYMAYMQGAQDFSHLGDDVAYFGVCVCVCVCTPAAVSGG